MNTENIIEYIKRGPGLKHSKISYWTEAFSFWLISFGLMMAGKSVGGHLEFWGFAILSTTTIHAICTVIFARKMSPLKNKLLLGGTASCMYTCLFAFFFTGLFSEFNLPIDVIEIYYALLVLIPVFLLLFYSSRLNSPTPLFLKKTTIKTISLSETQGRVALGKLILGIIVVCFGHFIPDRSFGIILVCTFLFIMYLIPIGILDLQRFYYYTKLEKMGLVTEDILKPEQ